MRRTLFQTPLTLLALIVANAASAQNPAGWRSTGAQQGRYGGAPGQGSAPQQPGAPAGVGAAAQQPEANSAAARAAGGELTSVGGGQPVARFTEKTPNLPRTHGQKWLDYDIRPYTLRTSGSARPEQVIVDWILRETGYEAWHTEPTSLLTATRETLSVYHTPEMQSIVMDIVSRFVNTRAGGYAFSLRIATVSNPNWRAKALPLMTPIPVQSPGVQGWLLAKEDATLLLAELMRRSDFREYSSSQQLINNGQAVLVSTMRPRTYMKGILPTATAWPGYQPEMGQLEEGFALEFSPLLGLDTKSADAVVKLRLNQVEKMLPVKLDLQNAVTSSQRVQVEVPQMTTANVHERFRWPTDKVLLLSMGVVATPGPEPGNPLTMAMPMLKSPPRADALLMVDCRSTGQPTGQPPGQVRAASQQPRQSFQGRY